MQNTDFIRTQLKQTYKKTNGQSKTASEQVPEPPEVVIPSVDTGGVVAEGEEHDTDTALMMTTQEDTTLSWVLHLTWTPWMM